ncbi:MAG TPA: amidohydrolase family protein [Sphingobium sp.]|nr:amidohydrolase family protein [Sphingobium sp.]
MSPTPSVAKTRTIDVHTHNFTPRWIDSLRNNPDENTQIIATHPHDVIDYRGAAIVRLAPEMTDFDLRIQAMDDNGIDIAVISLTSPHVFWGSREASIQAAREINDDFAAARKGYGDRIQWMASLPWQYPDAAITELHRAVDNGAAGICLLTNILGTPLTDEHFRPIWQAIEKSGLPAFVHPTPPFIDVSAMGMAEFGLANTIGFTADTSLCFARMILTGFLDRFADLKLIASHGGGTLPYLIARLDQMWARGKSKQLIDNPPSTYLRRFYYDAIVYDQKTLNFLVESVGSERILYGSDYPFLIQDMPGVKARVEALPEMQSRMILNDNAANLFKL